MAFIALKHLVEADLSKNNAEERVDHTAAALWSEAFMGGMNPVR
jgi:hypothetical protein